MIESNGNSHDQHKHTVAAPRCNSLPLVIAPSSMRCIGLESSEKLDQILARSLAFRLTLGSKLNYLVQPWKD